MEPSTLLYRLWERATPVPLIRTASSSPIEETCRIPSADDFVSAALSHLTPHFPLQGPEADLQREALLGFNAPLVSRCPSSATTGAFWVGRAGKVANETGVALLDQFAAPITSTVARRRGIRGAGGLELHANTLQSVSEQLQKRNFDPTRGGLRPYTTCVAEREALRITNARSKHVEWVADRDEGQFDPLSNLLEFQDGADNLIDHFTDPRLHQAVKQLPANDSDLLYRRFVLGLSYSELAEIYGESEATIRKRAQRCLERARRAME